MQYAKVATVDNRTNSCLGQSHVTVSVTSVTQIMTMSNLDASSRAHLVEQLLDNAPALSQLLCKQGMSRLPQLVEQLLDNAPASS